MNEGKKEKNIECMNVVFFVVSMTFIQKTGERCNKTFLAVIHHLRNELA
jgi:hypothetical protein